MWRDGRCLVVRRDSPFPDRCIKTNESAEGMRLEQRVRWSPGWLATIQLILSQGFLGHAVTLGAREATLHVGVSRRIWQRRRYKLVLGIAVVLVGFALMGGGIWTMPHGIAGAWALLGGLCLVLIGVVYYLNASQIVAAKRMSEQYVWLKGVHREFLAGLPEWPGEG